MSEGEQYQVVVLPCMHVFILNRLLLQASRRDVLQQNVQRIRNMFRGQHEKKSWSNDHDRADPLDKHFMAWLCENPEYGRYACMISHVVFMMTVAHTLVLTFVIGTCGSRLGC